MSLKRLLLCKQKNKDFDLACAMLMFVNVYYFKYDVNFLLAKIKKAFKFKIMNFNQKKMEKYQMLTFEFYGSNLVDENC